MIGVKGRKESLKDLPVRIIEINTAANVLSSLKKEKINTVVSKFDLPGAPAGQLLKRIIEARLWMPTVAMIKPGDIEQEILARTLGVKAVLHDSVSDEVFKDTICKLMKLKLNASKMASVALHYDYNSSTQYNFDALSFGYNKRHHLSPPIAGLASDQTTGPACEQPRQNRVKILKSKYRDSFEC